MREIKFRAWNKEKHIMVYKDEDDSSDYWDGVNCSNIGMVNYCLKNNNEYEWMQYTGLKDKSAKPIYEGDIVSEGGEYIGEVFYSNGAFWYCKDNWWPVQHMRDGVSSHFSGEIIGNIYENPELLRDVEP